MAFADRLKDCECLSISVDRLANRKHTIRSRSKTVIGARLTEPVAAYLREREQLARRGVSCREVLLRNRFHHRRLGQKRSCGRVARVSDQLARAFQVAATIVEAVLSNARVDRNEQRFEFAAHIAARAIQLDRRCTRTQRIGIVEAVERQLGASLEHNGVPRRFLRADLGRQGLDRRRGQRFVADGVRERDCVPQPLAQNVSVAGRSP